MSRYMINGGNRLDGEIKIQGSKNAALPIMAACVLNGAKTILHNVPDIQDVRIMKKILTSIGCKIKTETNTLIIDSSMINSAKVSEQLVSRMRSSIMLMGALVAKLKHAHFSYPGGCDIGLRPIDIHLKALKQLGANITEEHGYIIVDGKDLHAADIVLNYPSVGATENIILASVMTKGVTSIANAAKEPEIIDLQNFLNSLGARVYGAGSNTVYVEGVDRLCEGEYTIMADRIAAGTYMCATHICSGKVFLRGCSLENIKSPYYKLIESGLKVKVYSDGVQCISSKDIQSIDSIVTLPYPGFPTDLQPLFVAMLCYANGISIINETVFESRYRFTTQLLRMGANIKIEGRTAIIAGVNKLEGATVYAHDLRGGAALTIAALGAQGSSTVEDIHHIRRGYENFIGVLQNVGADIKYIN